MGDFNELAQHASLCLFLSECGWRGSASDMSHLVQWLVDQQITSRQELDEFAFEDFENLGQWPAEVNTCMGACV